MKISSKTGYFGVEPFRGSFKAIHRVGIHFKTIGIFPHAEDAAKAFDDYIVTKKGIARAFQYLNFPTTNHKKAYQEHLDAEASRRRRDEAQRQMRLQCTPILPSELRRLQERFHAGESVAELAVAFDTHESVVISTLRKLEIERLASIGLNLSTNTETTSDTSSQLSSTESKPGIMGRLFPSNESHRRKNG